MSPLIALFLFLLLLYVAWKLLKGILYVAFIGIVAVVVLGFVLHSGAILPGSTVNTGSVLIDARQWAAEGATWIYKACNHSRGA